jgi:hypothetical protein
VILLAGPVGAREGGACPHLPSTWPALPNVVALVNGEPLYREDVELAVLASLAAAGILYDGEAGRERLMELFRYQFRATVDRILLAQEAIRLGYRPWEGEAPARTETFLRRIPKSSLLDRCIAAFTRAVERLSAWAAAGEPFLRAVRGRIVVTPLDVERYYRQNLPQFKVPRSFLLSQVVFERKEEAEEAVRSLSGGRLEEVAAGRRVEQVLVFDGSPDPRAQVAGKLVPGSMAGPLELPEGYALVRLDEVRPARRVPLYEARRAIERRLRAAREARAMRDLIEALRSRARIELAPGAEWLVSRGV